MANVSAPFGFRQYGRREGGAPTAGLEVRTISSAYTCPVFTGDCVKQSSANPGYVVSANSSTGTGGTTTAITDLAYGVFMGCKYYNTNVNRTTWSSYWPGSGAQGDVQAFICSDPEQLYIAQGSTGGVLGSTCIGLTVPYSLTGSSAGNTLTGQSISFIQSSLVTGLSSNGQFLIVDVYQNVAPAGVNGTSTTAEGWQIAVLQPVNFVRRTIAPPTAAPAALLST